MPIYEYQCSKCGHEMDELQSMSAPPLTKCPNCGNNALQKLIGTGGGLIFKGSGFYLTDYKNKSKPDKSVVKSKDEKAKSAGESKIDPAGKAKETKGSAKEEVKSASKESPTKKESKKS
ncbi:MAG: zinc ribbon domain-containing protein [Ignavibacteria bacterium]|nr:zinc ribbon domain-containing protein [Ignavibacteria bacterium]